MPVAAEPQSDLSPAEVKAFDPSGQWVRRDGQPLGLIIRQLASGAWVVESFGKTSQGQNGNGCWQVFVGSRTGAELVTSSDLGPDSPGRCRARRCPTMLACS